MMLCNFACFKVIVMFLKIVTKISNFNQKFVTVETKCFNDYFDIVINFKDLKVQVLRVLKTIEVLFYGKYAHKSCKKF
jgi:hypothetical protein